MEGARQAARPSTWRKALVGVLLASAAGVYAYRQLAGPVYDPGEASAEPEAAALPEPTLEPSGIFRIPTVPAEGPVAIAIAPVPEAAPPVPRKAVQPAPVRSKFDEVFGIERPRAVPAVEAVVAEAAVPEPTIALSARIEPGADAASMVPPVPEADSQAPEVFAEVDIETAPEMELAAGDPAPVLAEQAMDAVPGEELQAAAEVPPVLDTLAEASPGPVAEIQAATAPVIEPPVELAAADVALPEPPMLRAQRVIPRRRESAPVAAPAAPAPLPVQQAPAGAAQAESAPSAASYVQHFPLVVLNGQPLGAITVREFAGGEQQIHLGALLSLFKLEMSAAEYERLIGSVSADQFVDLEVLREAGLEARYDARRGRLTVGSAGRR